jgi:hypothetical protein
MLLGINSIFLKEITFLGVLWFANVLGAALIGLILDFGQEYYKNTMSGAAAGGMSVVCLPAAPTLFIVPRLRAYKLYLQ